MSVEVNVDFVSQTLGLSVLDLTVSQLDGKVDQSVLLVYSDFDRLGARGKDEFGFHVSLDTPARGLTLAGISG